MVRHCEGTPGASVREGEWKLIRFFEDGRSGQHDELHSLKEDIGETRNVLVENAEVAGKLVKMITELQAETEGLGVAAAPLRRTDRPLDT